MSGTPFNPLAIIIPANHEENHGLAEELTLNPGGPIDQLEKKLDIDGIGNAAVTSRQCEKNDEDLDSLYHRGPVDPLDLASSDHLDLQAHHRVAEVIHARWTTLSDQQQNPSDPSVSFCQPSEHASSLLKLNEVLAEEKNAHFRPIDIPQSFGMSVNLAYLSGQASKTIEL